MNETNSLKLEDLDDVTLLEAIERAFEVQFVQDEVGQLHTVGDLFDLLEVKMGTTPQARQRCITAVSFYRLKKAVAEISGGQIGPDTAIMEVFPAKVLKRRMQALGQKTGLSLPSVPLSVEQWLLVLLVVSFCGTALFFGLATMPGITCLLIAIGFAGVLRLADFPGRLTNPCSFGELARQVAFLNYGRFARETGTRSSTDLWEALGFLIRNSIAFDGRIEKDTRLV